MARILGGAGNATAPRHRCRRAVGLWSERQDLNLRPLRPERNALAKLSYAPIIMSTARAGERCLAPPPVRSTYGRRSLVAGRWDLVAGRWSLAVGRRSLAAGRWPLGSGCRSPVARGNRPWSERRNERQTIGPCPCGTCRERPARPEQKPPQGDSRASATRVARGPGRRAPAGGSGGMAPRVKGGGCKSPGVVYCSRSRAMNSTT